MKTEELLSTTGETIEYAKMYMEQKADHFRLETAKRLARTTSNLATVAVVAIFGLMVMIFFSLAVGLLLGEYWDSYGLAFSVLTLFYVLLAFLVYTFKKQIITNPILTLIIREMLD
ncbi:MAG: phage holin family protein [Bacteroidota bacterium]